MPLTSTVTMVSAGKTKDGIFKISANLKVSNGTTDVIDKEFSICFRDKKIIKQDAQKKLLNMMQEEINLYKEGKTLSNGTLYKQIKANIESSLIM